MDLEKLKEPFPETDIEWRIGQSGVKGNGDPWAKVLAYITNRAIMDRLDAVCGPENWRNEFIPWTIGNEHGVRCGISIKIGDEWITKYDGAPSTGIEPIKGGFSDAMKRAGYQWGIGRYLYDLPEAWAEISDKGTHFAKTKNKDGKEVVFHWDPPRLKAAPQNGEQPEEGKKQKTPIAQLKAVYSELSCQGRDEWEPVLRFCTGGNYTTAKQATATEADAQHVLERIAACRAEAGDVDFVRYCLDQLETAAAMQGETREV